MRTLSVAALAAAAAMLHDARVADSCVGYVETTVWPEGEDVALGAVVRARLTRDLEGAERRLTLRPVGPEGTVLGAVEARVTVYRGTGDAMVVLAPRQPLAPYTAYQVMYAGEGGARELQRFVTGATRDEQPPTWSGGFAVTHYVAEGGEGGQGGAGVVEAAVREPDTLADDRSMVMMWGVWPSRARFDRTAPPLALLQADDVLRFGTGLGWNHVDLDQAAALDDDGDPVRLSLDLAPIDESGNLGAVARISIDRANATRSE